MKITDYPMLLIENDPAEILRVQGALARANLVNPLRIVDDGRKAMAYLSGQAEYADRDAHPFPALVLLDLALTGPSGTEVLAWIRAQAGLKNLPLILLTSSAPSAVFGANPRLAKPVQYEQLLEQMKSIGMYWMILDKTAPQAVPAASPPRGRRILVVDRDADFLRGIGEALLHRTPLLAVDRASDVAEALRRVAQDAPDAVVYERNLEDGEDFGFLDRVRALKAGLPVVVLCTEQDDAYAGRAIRKGAAGVLLKQIRQDQFADRLHALLAASTAPVPPPTPDAKPARAAGAVARERAPAKIESGGRRQDTDILGHQISFQNTSWELVRAAPQKDALDALIRAYWKPLYFFVRQRGFANEEAKDIVQDFLVGALEHGMIPRADPLRGRFRTFLLAALTNFLRDRRRSRGRLKRGGGRAPMSLDLEMGEPRYARASGGGEPPEKIVDRAWAKDLLGRCIAELAGKPSHLQAFELQMQGEDYVSIGKATGLSETAAKTAVHRLRGRLRGILRSHLSLQNATEEEVGREVAEFASLLA